MVQVQGWGRETGKVIHAVHTIFTWVLCDREGWPDRSVFTPAIHQIFTACSKDFHEVIHESRRDI